VWQDPAKNKIALLEILERNTRTLFWTMLKFGHFGVELGPSLITPFCGHFSHLGDQAASATEESWWGMPGVVPSI
jgi:hypothetical protein